MATAYSNTKRALIFAGAIFILLSQTLSTQGINTLQSQILTKYDAMSYFAYLTTLASFGLALMTPIGGKLSDLFGRKTILWIGAGIVFVSSIITSQAPTLSLFLFFRALIPFGQGITMVVPYAVMADVFEGKQRNMAYGILSGVLATGFFLGGTLGGWLADMDLLWLAIAYPGVLCFIGATLIAFCTKNQKAEGKIYIDFPGIVFLAIGLMAIIYAATFGNRVGWGTPTILAAIAIGAVAIFFFIRIEKKSKSPLLPIFMFKNPKVVGILAITLCTTLHIIIISVYTPLLIQNVMNMSTAVSGSVMGARSITNIIFPTIIAAWLTQKLDARLWQVLLLCGVMIASAFTLVWFSTPQSTLTIFFISYALLGIAESCKSTTITPFIQSVVDKKNMGSATALNSFFGVMGSSLSGCIVGILYNSMVPDPSDLVALNRGIHVLYLVAGLTGVAVILLAVFFVRGKKTDIVASS